MTVSVADEHPERADDGQPYLPEAGSGATRRPKNTLLKLREAH